MTDTNTDTDIDCDGLYMTDVTTLTTDALIDELARRGFDVLPRPTSLAQRLLAGTRFAPLADRVACGPSRNRGAITTTATTSPTTTATGSWWRGS